MKKVVDLWCNIRYIKHISSKEVAYTLFENLNTALDESR